jgi:hypothetical protein
MISYLNFAMHTIIVLKLLPAKLDVLMGLFLQHWVTKFGEPGSDMQGGPRNSYIEKQWARGAFVQLSVLRYAD